jgi:hypothetical protein
MRSNFAATVLGLALTLLIASPSAAYAASYLDEAVQALQSGNIYVSPETSSIDAATQAQLVSQMNGTGIAVVVLPASARSEAGDIPQFAATIARDSGKETVIVAVGDDLEAASRTMPSGTAGKFANDLERSTHSTGDALVKFVTEVRTSKPGDAPQATTGPDFSGIGIAAVLVVALCAGGLIWSRSQRRLKAQLSQRQESANVKIPPSIRELLSEIDRYTIQRYDRSEADEYTIRDDDMRIALSEAVSNTNELFVRLIKSKSTEIQLPTARYESMLSRLGRILHTYVDVQNHGKFYRAATDPEWQEKLLQSGKDAVSQYAEGVLNNIREIHRGSLTTFYADTYLTEEGFRTNGSIGSE